MSDLIRRTHDEAGNEYGKLSPEPISADEFLAKHTLPNLAKVAREMIGDDLRRMTTRGFRDNTEPQSHRSAEGSLSDTRPWCTHCYGTDAPCIGGHKDVKHPSQPPASDMDGQLKDTLADLWLAGKRDEAGDLSIAVAHTIVSALIDQISQRRETAARIEELELALTQSFDHKCEQGSERAVFDKHIHTRLAELRKGTE